MFDQVASPIIGLINALLGPLLGIVGAAGAIFCVVLGVKFAKAEEQHEKNFRAQGIPITYMAFRLDKTGPLVEPEWDQEPYEQTYKTLTRS